jgi:hypothetical protein
MILAATTQSLEIDLAGAVAVNELPFSAEWVDVASGVYTPGHSDGTSTGTTAATMVAAPGASTQRIIKYLSVYNKDTGAAIATVQFNNNSTLRELVVVKLDAGNELTWSPERGWRVSQISIASDTKSGLIRIASAGDVRSGTALDRALTPGRQAYHPSMSKCWGKAVGAGTSLTVSYNTTSVTDTGVGRLTVNIATDMQDNAYAILCTLERTVTTYAVADVEDNNVRFSTVYPGSFLIESYDHTATTMTVQDPTNYFWNCFGDWW